MTIFSSVIADHVDNIFVNREDEKKLIFDNIKIMKNKQKSAIFTFFISGVPGIGKTSLLNYVKNEIAQLQFKVAFIDLEEDAQTMPNNTNYLFEKLANQLFTLSDSWQKALSNYQEYGTREDGRHQDALINHFIDNLKLALAQQPIALLVDDSHHLDEITQRMLEQILEGVQDLNRMVVILTGRTDLRWHSFELNRCSKWINLPMLEKRVALELVDQDYSPLAELLYQITKGYPIAIIDANKWVRERFVADDPQLVAKVNHQERELVSVLVKSIFERHILEPISEIENPEIIGKIIKNISPLRRFDDYLLLALLPKLDDQFATIDAATTRSYMRQMSTKTFLMKWERQAYTIDKSMRQLLMLWLKHEQFEKLNQIHTFMISWYEHAIDKITKNKEKSKSNPQSVIYFIEQLYHELQLGLLKNDDLESTAREKIEISFKSYEWRERNHFFEEFKLDMDLHELLGDGHERLMTRIEQLVNESVNGLV